MSEPTLYREWDADRYHIHLFAPSATTPTNLGACVICGAVQKYVVPVKVTEDDWRWLLGWVTAGFSEFLVGQKENDEEWGRYFRIEKALLDRRRR